MRHFSEIFRIEILIIEDIRTQVEVLEYFQETHSDLPTLSTGNVYKIEQHFRQLGDVKPLPRDQETFGH